MAMHVRNITFHILNNLLSFSSIGWFLLSLFPIGRDLHFSLRIWVAENTPTSRFTIQMKLLWQSPMRIHDVAGKSAITICIMKALSSLLSAFMKKIAGLCRHHECGMLNLEYA
jgi:hypothetical protein